MNPFPLQRRNSKIVFGKNSAILIPQVLAKLHILRQLVLSLALIAQRNHPGAKSCPSLEESKSESDHTWYCIIQLNTREVEMLYTNHLESILCSFSFFFFFPRMWNPSQCLGVANM